MSENQPVFSEKIYSEDELKLIQDIFKDDRNIKILRKVFLPSYDYDAPIGQAFDLMSMAPLEQMGISERLMRVEVVRGIMKHIEARLLDLKVLAHPPEEPKEDKRDGTK